MGARLGYFHLAPISVFFRDLWTSRKRTFTELGSVPLLPLDLACARPDCVYGPLSVSSAGMALKSETHGCAERHQIWARGKRWLRCLIVPMRML